jgi:ADP-ribose pyrophosphatase
MKPPKLIKKTVVYKGEYRSVINKTYKFPNGKKFNFDIVNDYRDLVYVAAFTKNDEIILVEQFRPGPEKTLLDLPAGKTEVGEKPINVAKRELLEETGYKCQKMIKLGESWQWSYSQSRCYFFLALNCEKVQKLKLDEDEVITVKLMKLDKYLKHVKLKGDLVAIHCLYLAVDKLKSL